MTFFDPTGNQLSYHQWLTTYEPCYFIGGPTHGGCFSGGYQSSRFVEGEVEARLVQRSPLTQNDLVLVMAWKIGTVIDHQQSQASSAIRYKNNWPSKLIAYGFHRPWNFSQSIPYLAANMTTIRHQLKVNPHHLFNLQLQGSGFGPVHRLALHFFVTNGRDPIFDRFAHRAALAIDQNLPPGSTVNYRAVQSWQDYQAFKQLLGRIGLQAQGTMFTSRADDRALWMYGHFFKV
jgi:hypothetical protein